MKRVVCDLPLRWRTPGVWASQALQEPLALLNDHAHLEKKAAANALELLTRWPAPSPPENWVQVLTAVARDEIDHLARVTRLLARRGGELSQMHRNDYASGLRELVRKGEGTDEVMDRLMVSALIEARSCERFELLAGVCTDRELAALYSELCASEAGHYQVFIGLARDLPGAGRCVDWRWHQMLDAEAALIQSQPPGPRMHSGLGP